jgi:hypothetical protein
MMSMGTGYADRALQKENVPNYYIILHVVVHGKVAVSYSLECTCGKGY